MYELRFPPLQAFKRIGNLLLGLPGLVFALQPVQAQDETGTIEEITVTGSLIKREESSQLVTSIDSEEIELRGATSAVEILDAITTGQAPLLTSNVASAFNPSYTNFANLRSLGGQSTLVLLDGRRIVREPFSGRAVNLNIVPTSLLDAVDVLSDGASSIYGSDAIAGVINFRTFDALEGVEYYVHSSNPVEPGGAQIKGSLAAGYGNLSQDGFNVFIGATWRDREEIRGPDRDFLHEQPRADKGQRVIPGRLEAQPGNVRQDSAGIGGHGVNPWPQCDPPLQLSNGAGACYLSLLGRNFIVMSGEEQQSVTAKLTAELSDDHVFSAQYFHAWSQMFNTFGPGRRSETIPTTSPFYPGGGLIPAIPGQDLTAPVRTQNAQVGYRKDRTNQIDDWANRLMASLEGTVGSIDYELWALNSAAEIGISNQLYNPEINNGVPGTNGAPWINPFAWFEDQPSDAQSFILANDLGVVENRHGESDLTSAGLTISGDALEMAAGPLSYAFALEFQEESIFLQDLPVRSMAGLRVQPDQMGERDVLSVSGEVLIPLSDQFEINASLRYDDYSDAGATTNPKILLDWNLTPNFNLHASANTGFRAPTLFDVFAPNRYAFTTANPVQADPDRCNRSTNPWTPVFPGEDDFFHVCRGQYSTLLGGNRNLDPEISTVFAVGTDFNFEVGDGRVNLRVDYWDYNIEDIIGPIDVIAIFQDLDQFGHFIIRCNDLPPEDLEGTITCEDDPNGPNRIGAIEQFLQNLGTVNTSGFDIKGRWDQEFSGGYSLGVTYNATIVNEYEQQRYPGDGFHSRLGTFLGTQGPVFEYQHYLAATLSRDNWNLRAQHRHKSSYGDCNRACGIATEYHNEVDAYGLVDLAGTWRFNDRLAMTLHVLNVLDTDPPFTNNARQGSALSANIDTRYTDPRGRSVGVTLRGNFE